MSELPLDPTTLELTPLNPTTIDLAVVTQSLLATGPEIIIIIGACAALMLSLVPHQRQYQLLTALSVLMIILAAAMSYFLGDYPQTAYAGMFVIDGFSTFFKMILYLGTALTVLMSGKYLIKEGVVQGEYYALLLFSLVGTMIMVSAADLLLIYIGLELQALSIYVLTGFLKADARSNEASLKYIIVGAFSSAILLYGMSLFYGLTGTTNLSEMATVLLTLDLSDPKLTLATLFMLVGLLFKVGAVPFHMWVPDIYEGAPSPITAYMSVAAKAAAFAVIIRIFMQDLSMLQPIWILNMAAISVLTMTVGSFVALVQKNIKRMLAYSSIAHAGFLMLGLVAGGKEAMTSIMLYLLVYTFMTVGIFAVIILLNKSVLLGEPIEDFSGLANNHPGLAFMSLIFLLSLAGIPPTGGFFAKFYVLTALVDKGHVVLAVLAVLLSAVAAWFYIRIIMLMYVQQPAGQAEIHITPSIWTVLLIATVGTLLTGLLPSWFLDFAAGSMR
ncbi:MAG: NADH-quinone oxidoreductase subunit N [Bermanella sp.]